MSAQPGERRLPATGPGRAGGQGFVEFGVILALAAVVAVAILVLFRPQLAWVLSMIGSEVDKAGQVLLGLAPA
jgi:Flp pilus assembly pilin Flp